MRVSFYQHCGSCCDLCQKAEPDPTIAKNRVRIESDISLSLVVFNRFNANANANMSISLIHICCTGLYILILYYMICISVWCLVGSKLGGGKVPINHTE